MSNDANLHVTPHLRSSPSWCRLTAPWVLLLEWLERAYDRYCPGAFRVPCVTNDRTAGAGASRHRRVGYPWEHTGHGVNASGSLRAVDPVLILPVAHLESRRHSPVGHLGCSLRSLNRIVLARVVRGSAVSGGVAGLVGIQDSCVEVPR